MPPEYPFISGCIMDNQFATLDAFLEYLRQLREGISVQVVNPDRIKQLQASYNIITQLVRQTDPDAKIECKLHEINDGSAAITVTATDLIIDDIAKFIESLDGVDNFEVYPTTDNKIEIGIMFENVLTM